MSERTRIGLRLLGVLLLLLGIGGFVLMISKGPSGIADWMGNSCVHSDNGPTAPCEISDVLGFLIVPPILSFVGGLMAIVLRPPGKSPLTIDLSGGRRDL